VSIEYKDYLILTTKTVNQNLINITLNMVGKKRTRKVVLKLTKQQLQMVEDQYWKRYNNHKLNTMLNG